jgi:hypothetical protein
MQEDMLMKVRTEKLVSDQVSTSPHCGTVERTGKIPVSWDLENGRVQSKKVGHTNHGAI